MDQTVYLPAKVDMLVLTEMRPGRVCRLVNGVETPLIVQVNLCSTYILEDRVVLHLPQLCNSHVVEQSYFLYGLIHVLKVHLTPKVFSLV